MVEQGAIDEPVTGLRVSYVVRALIAATVTGFAWFAGRFHTQPNLLAGSSRALLLTGIFAVTFLVVGAARVRFLPEVVVVHTLLRREVIRWDEITDISQVTPLSDKRVTIHAPRGCWRCPLLATPSGLLSTIGARSQLECLRTAWLGQSPGGPVSATPVPWGPDLLSFDRVVMSPVGLQWLTPGFSLTNSIGSRFGRFSARRAAAAWTTEPIP